MATIDYKEKYEQALEVAQRFYNNSVAVTKKGLEDIFPELKESGDESVRKALIEFVQGMYTGCRTEEACKERDMFLAWLEKQGEHSNFLSKIQVGDKVTRNEDGVLVNLSQLNRVAKKQGEQKPADKVEPKFKVGDWVIDKQGLVHQIANVIENVTCHTYAYDIVGGGYFNDNTEGVRLWTIKDAKDGDVLADDYGIYIFEKFDECDRNCYVCIGAYQYSQKVYECEHMLCSTDAHPATKEQCDTLMKAMADAGYEWDAENRQLRKIEPRQEELTEFEKAVKQVMEEAIECGDTHNLKADADTLLRLVQKSSCSEEDDTFFKAIIRDIENIQYIREDAKKNRINWLKSLKYRVGCEVNYTTTKEWSDYDECMLTNLIDDPNCSIDSEYVHWLKTLKERFTWKPSDMQMESLKGTINSLPHQEVLYSLYQDLKKLKG